MYQRYITEAQAFGAARAELARIRGESRERATSRARPLPDLPEHIRASLKRSNYGPGDHFNDIQKRADAEQRRIVIAEAERYAATFPIRRPRIPEHACPRRPNSPT